MSISSTSEISQRRNISASLCSAKKLIKYSKPHAVRARRNAFMRDFQIFRDLPSMAAFSSPKHSFISLPIGSYLELVVFRDDFSLVASVNMLDFRECFILFLNLLLLTKSATLRKGTRPGLCSLGVFPTFRSRLFRHGCLYVESSKGGREGLK